MAKASISLMLLLLAFFGFSSALKCQHPPVAENYRNDLYQGRWYEIGKIQTPGGAAFQEGTMCTIATYVPDNPENGGGSIGYSARKSSPSGNWVNATGTLTQLEVPGHFDQQLTIFGIPMPKVDYNVIHIDEDSAIEFDCDDNFLGKYEYCIHIMSRTPTMSAEKVQQLIDFAEGLGLNANQLEYKAGDQEGCW